MRNVIAYIPECEIALGGQQRFLRPALPGRREVLMKSVWLTGVALLLACGSGISASGQTDRGTITGTVTDSSGAVVPNAKVTAKDTNTGAERSTTTSSEGDYTIPELPAAPYQVTAEAQGFRKLTQSLQLPVQVTRRADFKLTVGAATETTTCNCETETCWRSARLRGGTTWERRPRCVAKSKTRAHMVFAPVNG